MTAIILVLVALGGNIPPARAQTPRSTAWDVVFVADGAGNFQMASKNLRSVVEQCNLPLTVHTFEWSHGNKKILPDQTDLAHAHEKGVCLAQFVLAYRQAHPEARINLLGHSAGSMVILSATQYLPPGSIDQVTLLLPSVSSAYDIRPALRSVTGNVEVHYSSHDWIYLGLCTQLIGCADGPRAGPAGRVGFQLRIECPADAALLSRLVQIPWQSSYRQLGNEGGHYGAYQPDYLQACVLPRLMGGLR